MTCRIDNAERHHISASCKSLLDSGLNSERVRYLASGRYSDCFSLTVTSSREVVAKVSTYREGCLRAIARCMVVGDYHKAKKILMGDAVCISNKLAAITNLILSRGITPHLVWNFGDFDCKGFFQQACRSRLAVPLRKRMKELQKEGCRLQSLYSNVSFHEKFHFDLTDFLHNNHVTSYCLKCIIFQVIYTVSCLQDIMPGFRHNDLSTNNIFITCREDVQDTANRYMLSDGTSIFTCIPHIMMAIADWDFAHCQNTVSYTGHDVCLQNERVVSGAYSLKPRPNPTYDTHFFLTTLLQQIRNRPRTYKDIIDFLKHVCGKWSDRCDIMLPRLEPSRLLQHHFFDELRETPEIPVAETYSV